jgi:hypothetical protein
MNQRCSYPKINTTNCCDIIKLIDALFLEGTGCLLLFTIEKEKELSLALPQCKYSIVL